MAYAVFDAANKNSRITLSGGDLTATSDSSGTAQAAAVLTEYKSTGQWYAEFTLNTASPLLFIGLAESTFPFTTDARRIGETYSGSTVSYGFRTDNGSLQRGGSNVHTYTNTPWASGDVIGLKFDADAGTLEVTQNGVSRGTYSSIDMSGGKAYIPAISFVSATPNAVTANFGDSAWANAPGGSYAGWPEVPQPTVAASFEEMAASAGAHGGTPSFQPMTASLSVPPSIAASFEAMTAAATPGITAAGTFEEMTASMTSVAGSSGTLEATFGRMTADADGSAGSVGTVTASFEEMTAAWYGDPYLLGTFNAMSASGTGLVGTVASLGASFRAMAAEGAGSGYSIGTVSARFQPMVAQGAGSAPTFGTVDASFRRMHAQGSALVGSVGVIAASFEEMDPALVGTVPTVGSVVATFERLRGSGRGAPALASTFRAWSMNASNEAVTEYQAYPFSGFAELDGRRFGAGPSGIYLLSGADDEGENIDWSFRTGFMDGTGARGVRRSLPAQDLLRKKRLDEILMSLRFDGPLRVRVWTDEDTYFDYNVPNYRPDVIHQVRAKLGRGLLSRFYRVQVSGVDNASIELSTMELPMTPVNRRLG